MRRAALGLIRILLEARIELPLDRLLSLASEGLAAQMSINPDLIDDVRVFIIDRARNYFREKDFSADLINASIASDWDTLPDLDDRLHALSDFMGLSAAASLAAANKRIGNILRKSGDSHSLQINEDKLVLEEEAQLFDGVNTVQIELEPLLSTGNYGSGLALLASLRDPIDAFFESVMVMDEDVELRNNRLALLARLKALFDRIADLSVLA